jgi:hypothetical protein
LNVCTAELSTRVHAQIRDAITTLRFSIVDWIVEGINYPVPTLMLDVGSNRGHATVNTD